mgnify:CR=1 FL=1
MQAYDLIIRVHGWALVQVKDAGTAWCYTVGLTESYGHPELTIVDAELDHAARMITQLVEGIKSAGELSATTMRRFGVRCVEVHRDHLWGDLFGTWSNRYGCLLQPGEMLQVVLPADAYCECHRHQVRRLDRPAPPPAPPNRAERRRRGGGHAA